MRIGAQRAVLPGLDGPAADESDVVAAHDLDLADGAVVLPLEKVDLFEKIVGEMIEYFSGSGLDCKRSDGILQIRKPGERKTWQLCTCSTDPAETPATGALDVFLSLCEIPEQMRVAFTARNIMWIDISRRQQSRLANDLGNEVLLFFKRYGVRTLRSPSLRP